MRGAGRRGNPIPQGLPPSSRLCSTLAAGQCRRPGGADPLLRSLTVTEHCKWQLQACEGIYWGQVSRNQVWQSSWPQGFCPVLGSFSGEVSTKLFCFLMQVLQCPSEHSKCRAAQLLQEQEGMWSKALPQLLMCHGDGDCENWEEMQGICCSAIWKHLKTPLCVLVAGPLYSNNTSKHQY